MGKKTKARKADFRKKEKAKRKTQQKALYESFKKQGTNSKRNKIKEKKAVKMKTKRHLVSFCGNQGCDRCFPILARPRMNDSNDPRVRFKVAKEQT